MQLIFSVAGVIFPDDVYRFGSVFSGNMNRIVEPVNEDEFVELQASHHTRATTQRPIYVIRDNALFVRPNIGRVTISYIRRPEDVRWGYVVVDDKALYDPGRTEHFQLHQKEQTELVYRILKLSGASLQRQDITSFAQAMQSAHDQEEKA